MRSRSFLGAAGVVMLGLGPATQPALATDLFDLSVIVNPNTPGQASGAASLPTITDLANGLSNTGLQSIVPAYQPNTSAASVTLNVRGVPASASYAFGSTTLNFKVPSAGINMNFNGATRDDSQIMLKNFLLQNGGSLMTALLQDLVAHSPVDPVAGNPNSLQNSMAASDFSIGTGIGLQGTEIPGGAGAGLLGQPNLVSGGGDVGFASAGGINSTIVTLPLRYTIAFANPEYALTLDMPLTWVGTQGASSYFGSFGASLRIPVLPNWYLSPSIRGGAAGSIDLGAAAFQYSGGVASRYDMFLGDLAITVGNSITVAKTAPLSISTVSVNYNLTNEIFTNGVQVEGSLPYHMFGDPTSWQAYVADTNVAGSAVYVSHYDEIGFTVGSRRGLNGQDWNALRVGAGFTFGDHYTAYKLGFTYRF